MSCQELQHLRRRRDIVAAETGGDGEAEPEDGEEDGVVALQCAALPALLQQRRVQVGPEGEEGQFGEACHLAGSSPSAAKSPSILLHEADSENLQNIMFKHSSALRLKYYD
jgi:hypothetical protein